MAIDGNYDLNVKSSIQEYRAKRERSIVE